MKHRSLGLGWASRGRFAESAVHRVSVGGSHVKTFPGGRLPWLPRVARGATHPSAGPRLAAFHRSAWTARRRFAFGCYLAALVMVGETSEGALTFQAAASFAAGDRPFNVAVADLNGDTVPDLVIANFLSDDVSVLLGNGDGTFQAAVSFPAGFSPTPSPWPTSTATPSPISSPPILAATT